MLNTQSSNFAAPIRPEIENLATSQIAEVFYVGQAHPRLVPLWFGEGDTPTPDFVVQACARAIAEGKVNYADDRGAAPLRAAVASYLARLHGRPVADDRIQIAPSGMSCLMLIVQAILGPGDNMVHVAPVWPNIFQAVRVAGGEPRAVALRHTESGWRLDLERLFAACDERTRAIFVNSPGNPTGWVMSEDDIAAVLAFCRKRRIWFVADEVYSRLCFGVPRAPSPLDICEPDDPVFSVNSFSKAWAMTGWRLGWIAGPAWTVPHLRKLNQYSTSGAATFVQYAGIAALEQGEPFIAAQNERLRRARDLVVQGLRRYPRVQLTPPPGAFYAFFKVDGLDDSLGFAKKLVLDTGVGLAPGSAFGPEGEGYLRLCFASSEARLSEALDRLGPLLS